MPRFTTKRRPKTAVRNPIHSALERPHKKKVNAISDAVSRMSVLQYSNYGLRSSTPSIVAVNIPGKLAEQLELPDSHGHIVSQINFTFSLITLACIIVMDMEEERLLPTHRDEKHGVYKANAAERRLFRYLFKDILIFVSVFANIFLLAYIFIGSDIQDCVKKTSAYCKFVSHATYTILACVTIVLINRESAII